MASDVRTVPAVTVASGGRPVLAGCPRRGRPRTEGTTAGAGTHAAPRGAPARAEWTIPSAAAGPAAHLRRRPCRLVHAPPPSVRSREPGVRLGLGGPPHAPVCAAPNQRKHRAGLVCLLGIGARPSDDLGRPARSAFRLNHIRAELLGRSRRGSGGCAPGRLCVIGRNSGPARGRPPELHVRPVRAVRPPQASTASVCWRG